MTAHTISIVQTPNYEPTFFTLIGFLLALKSAVRDVVQPDHRLVGVLHNQILSILLGHYQVKDTPDNTPGIVHAKVDLLAKLNRFELLGSKDDVPRAVLHIVP